jgi:hypothetical protein
MSEGPTHDGESTRSLEVDNYEIRSTDLLELWKYFEAKGDTDKERMITIVSWLLGFAVAVLGLSVTELWCDSGWLRFLALDAGALLICVYSLWLIVDFGDHARRNWLRAEECLSKFPVLQSIRDSTYIPPEKAEGILAKNRAMAPVFKNFRNIVLVVGFLCVLVPVVRCFHLKYRGCHDRSSTAPAADNTGFDRGGHGAFVTGRYWGDSWVSFAGSPWFGGSRSNQE